jgi:xanthine/CO dehydrogenase XdhC/CoxF family maturation factor
LAGPALAALLDDAGAVLAALSAWRAEGHRAALATVIETWGSAPRRVGAWLAIRDDGHFLGSVSGGCVEGAVLAEAPDVIAEGGFRVLEYGVADAQAWEVGLACGGRIRVLLQAVDDTAFPPALVEALAAARADGRVLGLATDLVSGRTESRRRRGFRAPHRAALPADDRGGRAHRRAPGGAGAGAGVRGDGNRPAWGLRGEPGVRGHGRG